MDHGGTEGDPPAMPGWKRLQEGDGAPDVCPSCGGPAPVPLQVCLCTVVPGPSHNQQFQLDSGSPDADRCPATSPVPRGVSSGNSEEH